MHTLISILKPTLNALLAPPTLFLLLMLLAFLLRKHRRSASMLFLSSLLATWITCTQVGSQALLHHLLQPPPALTLQTLAATPRTAVLVLGGGAFQHLPEYGMASLTPISMARLRYGIWLARQAKLPLAFTGGRLFRPADADVSEAATAQRTAREEYGYPLRWSEDQATNTRENARLSLPILQAAGIDRVLLVTHAAHMPRALRAFEEAQGQNRITVVAAPMGFRQSKPYEFEDWWPSAEGVQTSRYVAYELMAWVAGR